MKYDRTPDWIVQHYGWNAMSEVNVLMLRKNLAALRRILASPAEFPHANIPRVEALENRLWTFLTVDCCDVTTLCGD